MLERTGETKELKRDSGSKIGYINIPYLNTGSVADIQIGESNNKKLDALLDKLENDLSNDRIEFKMDDFFAKSN